MAASSLHARRTSPSAWTRIVVACLALVAWVGVQAAALAHVGCGTCTAGAPHDHDGCRADVSHPSSRCCHGHRHAPNEGHGERDGDAHDDAHADAPSPPRGGDDAPDDHDTGTCTLCAFAAGAVDAPAVVVALAPATAGTPRAPTPFVAPPSAPRFEPGLARGPPTLPRS